jgi:hypothetical protein
MTYMVEVASTYLDVYLVDITGNACPFKPMSTRISIRFFRR